MPDRTGTYPVVLRPHRWRQIGAIAAAVIIGVTIVSAATFTGTKAQCHVA